MDPSTLVEQAVSGVPAPIWFVQFFKVLGFTLHAMPMSLWYAGLLIALVLHLRGNEHGRRFGGRLLQQMPVIVAIGVNLGIVPLLFVQTAYYKVFYPATILMAWPWLAIIALLIPAYYGIYLYAWGLKNGEKLARLRVVAGWCAAAMFIVIGFIFANGMSLMGHVDRWVELWSDNSVAGAASGTALNIGDATLWPRWLLMFGLALQTTAAWLLFDAEWLGGMAAVPAAAKQLDDNYRRWAWGFAKKLYTVGLIWFAAAGSWYVFGSWTPELRESMFAWPLVLLAVLPAIAPGLSWLLVCFGGRTKAIALLAFLAQFCVLAVNALSRQFVQNLNLKPYWDVYSLPEDIQWGPLAMFLIVFVIGLGVIGWMVAQIRKCDSA
ncbi:MAG: hypothetical protein JW959_08305 [Pirellulales bacterium]|nr:hypothetical protein [Pirellulales bacterium]